MDDSIFARLGYDPVRIHAHIHGQPPAPGGIARLGGPSPPHREDPASAAALSHALLAEEGSEALVPPRDGEVAAAPAADGGGPPSAAAAGDSRLHHPAPAATEGPPDGEEPDDEADEYELQDWLLEHWDEVHALVRARHAPVEPPPPPPEPEAAAEPDERPIVHVARGDRWNKWKMAEFLRQLAATHSVSAAAKAVGMSRNSAYKLRSRLKGQPFDIAWEAAFRHGYDDLAHAALELALEGEEVPHYYQGELRGTHRKRNPQLIMGLLRMRNRAGAPMLGRYGAAAEFWTERWEQMTHRVETGSVTWADEHAALGKEELEKLELPDARREADLLIARNLPDEPRGRKS